MESNYKARIVAKGYAQMPGIDFNEVFSPIARMETITLLFALAVQMKLLVYNLDVKSAFLNGEIMEKVFVDQSEGYEVPGSSGKVYRLKKALYGLRQVPRVWYSRIDCHFLKHSFRRSEIEHTLYIKKHGENGLLLVCLYVDDVVFISSSTILLEDLRMI